jgi:hypothetical protein
LSNTTFQNYDDIIERSCQAWNEILSENGFIKNLCSREWSFLVWLFFEQLFKISYIEHPKKPSLFLDLILYFLGTHPLVFYMPAFHGIFYGYKTQYNHPHQ